MTNQTISGAGGINANITPFAFQFYAKDFYEAYKKHKVGAKFSPARLFLLTRSIELAAKSLLLDNGKTPNYIKAIKHNLEKACDQSVLSKYQIIISQTEIKELKKANIYYKDKGFEYFLFNYPGITPDRSGPQLALSGWPNLPDETILEELLKKLLTPVL